MGNKQVRTCELNDPISIIIGDIIGIGFILIMLFVCIIIKLSSKCTCTCDKKIDSIIEKNNNIISSLETENLMVIQNNTNENNRLLNVLEKLAENIIMKPIIF